MAMGACAVQFLHFILSGEMYYIALLLTVAKKRVCAPVAHKSIFPTIRVVLVGNRLLE